MKHFFIINPAAGKRTQTQALSEKITAFCEEKGIEYEIYFTKGVQDAEKFVKESFVKGSRYYACGGDGTLNEVANAIYSCGDASVGMIPIGTGNDFPKNFSSFDDFFDFSFTAFN